MRALAFSDLHIDANNRVSIEKLARISRMRVKPDAVLLCGDNAEVTHGLGNHRLLFDVLLERFQSPLGFIAGNHDLYGRPSGFTSRELLDETYPALAEELDVMYLERDNLVVGDTTVVGTYGHYDYTLGRVRGTVDEESFRSGVAIVGGRELGWSDHRYMDWCGESDPAVCKKLLSEFWRRLPDAGDVLTVSHTAPTKRLVGWSDSPKQDFFGAFSGSTMLEDILSDSVSRFHLCGHTHHYARERIGDTRCVNIGSDYRDIAYALVDTETNTMVVKRIEL